MCTFEGVGKNICGGDSGGPLYDQTNNIIAGVVSWGVGACGRGNADVYSRIGVQVCCKNNKCRFDFIQSAE